MPTKSPTVIPAMVPIRTFTFLRLKIASVDEAIIVTGMAKKKMSMKYGIIVSRKPSASGAAVCAR